MQTLQNGQMIFPIFIDGTSLSLDASGSIEYKIMILKKEQEEEEEGEHQSAQSRWWPAARTAAGHEGEEAALAQRSVESSDVSNLASRGQQRGDKLSDAAGLMMGWTENISSHVVQCLFRLY